jgi:hypothetical protein
MPELTDPDLVAGLRRYFGMPGLEVPIPVDAKYAAISFFCAAVKVTGLAGALLTDLSLMDEETKFGFFATYLPLLAPTVFGALLIATPPPPTTLPPLALGMIAPLVGAFAYVPCLPNAIVLPFD